MSQEPTSQEAPMNPGTAKLFQIALKRRREQMLTCISCGAKTKEGEAPPCGH